MPVEEGGGIAWEKIQYEGEQAEYERHKNLLNWMQFLRAKTKEEFEMVAERNLEIRKAADVLYELSADKEVRAQYEFREKAERDRLWMLGSAREDGIEIGMQQGMQAGRQEMVELLKSGKTLEEIKKILGVEDHQ